MLLELGARQLTHELLVTLMSEVAAIINARPITAIPSDIDEPLPLTPAMLLTQKTRPGTSTTQDVYTWQRWRKLQFLAGQVRTKWNKEQRNLAVGDIVLMKDEEAHRNNATHGTFFWKNCEARVAENFKVLSDFWKNTKKTNILKEGIWILLHGLRKKNCKQNNTLTIVVITSCLNFFFEARAFVVMQKKYHNLVGIVKITLMGRTEICMYRLCLFFKKTVDILIRVRRENQQD